MAGGFSKCSHLALHFTHDILHRTQHAAQQHGDPHSAGQHAAEHQQELRAHLLGPQSFFHSNQSLFGKMHARMKTGRFVTSSTSDTLEPGRAVSGAASAFRAPLPRPPTATPRTAARVLSSRAHAIFHDIITINLAHPKHLVDIGFIPRGRQTSSATTASSECRAAAVTSVAPYPTQADSQPRATAPPLNPNPTNQPNPPERDQSHETPPVPWYERMRQAVVGVIPHPPRGWGALAGALLPRSWAPSWRAGRTSPPMGDPATPDPERLRPQRRHTNP